jgi:arabinoxylan arabinofuranohydrolase
MKSIVNIILPLFCIFLVTSCGSVPAVNKENESEEIGPVVLNTKESWKKRGYHNPLMTQRFGADPFVLVYGDTVYVYMTGDIIEKDGSGKVGNNTYGKIHKINILSSKDLVNWTDCGNVDVTVPGVSAWAHNSWAPAAAFKKIDGKDTFFLYFGDSANGIGVLTSENPAGPFKDPLGHALITRNTKNCGDVTWLFDPAVFVDDDGTAYLYFGGGVPGGSSSTDKQKSNPCTARAVKLGDDMISLEGEPVVIDAPYMFEDSGINKFGDTYYYSYCTNWDVPNGKDFRSGQIAYMTSSSPLGPFHFKGIVLRNPGDFFGQGGNNHHCMFSFMGENYIAYHARILEQHMMILHGYRSTNIDKLIVNENNMLESVAASERGVQQVCSLNPFETVNATTLSSMAGIQTTPCSKISRYYGCGEMAVNGIDRGDWLYIEGADFGADGAASFTVSVKCNPKCSGGIDLCVDTEKDTAVAIDFSGCHSGEDFQEVTGKLTVPITGKHNLLFVFTGSGFEWKDWRFSK